MLFEVVWVWFLSPPVRSPDRPGAPDLITIEYSSIIGIDRMFHK